MIENKIENSIHQNLYQPKKRIEKCQCQNYKCIWKNPSCTFEELWERLKTDANCLIIYSEQSINQTVYNFFVRFKKYKTHKIFEKINEEINSEMSFHTNQDIEKFFKVEKSKIFGRLIKRNNKSKILASRFKGTWKNCPYNYEKVWEILKNLGGTYLIIQRVKNSESFKFFIRFKNIKNKDFWKTFNNEIVVENSYNSIKDIKSLECEDYTTFGKFKKRRNLKKKTRKY